MLIYLINATIIWALSLALFDALFRRSGRHTANRAYLLGTLLLGIVLPLISPVSDAVPDVNPGLRVVTQLQAIPSTHQVPQSNPVSAPETSALPTLTTANWLLLLYIAGACILLARLLWDGWKLHRLAQQSKPHVAFGQEVHQTGGAHAPFSFFNRVFVSHIAAFSKDELRMVLQHERRHARLLHSVDVMMLELLRVLFWFHPAIWLYCRRVRVVHEFQADAAVQGDCLAYGHFLLEQALLRRGPSLTTSVNHSPIKTRIHMLTQPASKNSWRYLAALPLMAITVVCCSRQDAKKETTTQSKTSADGNVFEMSNMVQQSILIRDARTGKIDTTFMTVLPQPTTMNGETIYHIDNVTKEPQYAGPEANATEELFKHITPDLAKLDDGMYFLMMPSIIVGKDGGVVYSGDADIYGSSGTLAIGKNADSMFQFKHGKLTVSLPEPSKKSIDINDRTRREIVDAVNQVLTKKLKFLPAQKDGKAVIAYAGESVPFGQGGHIVVENSVPKMADDFMRQNGD